MSHYIVQNAKLISNLMYYLQLQNKCHAVTESTESFPVGISRIPTPFLPNQTAKDYPSTAENDVRPKTKNSKKFPSLSENSTKKTPRGRDWANDIPLKSNHNPKLSSSVDEAAYNIMRSCSQCGILLPLPILSQHQVLTAYLLFSSGCEPSRNPRPTEHS